MDFNIDLSGPFRGMKYSTHGVVSNKAIYKMNTRETYNLFMCLFCFLTTLKWCAWLKPSLWTCLTTFLYVHDIAGRHRHSNGNKTQQDRVTHNMRRPQCVTCLRGIEVILRLYIFDCPEGRFKYVCELVNLGALKASLLNKHHIVQCMGKLCCMEFQRVHLQLTCTQTSKRNM